LELDNDCDLDLRPLAVDHCVEIGNNLLLELACTKISIMLGAAQSILVTSDACAYNNEDHYKLIQVVRES
jgi:hypothetical protein